MYISSSGRNELVEVRFLQTPGARVPKDLGLNHQSAVRPLAARLVARLCVPQFSHL